MLIDGEWVYAGKLIGQRDYLSFGIMAGVRRLDVDCITIEPRGFPEDASAVLQQIAGYDGGDDFGDYHSHSYLSLEEIYEARDRYKEEESEEWDFPEKYFCMEELLDIPGVEEVRVVFWFDN